jgi:hypothetical protein
MKVKVAAKLKDTRNGYSKIYRYEVEPEYADSQWYMWHEGNYSCDDNRSIFLYNWDEDKKLDCNHGDNLIELVWLKINGVKQ